MIKAQVSIPVVTPSNNEIRNMNSWVYKRLKKSYAAHIQGMLLDQKYEIEPVKKPCRRQVQIISYRKRTFDKDNHYGGLKPLLDALKDIGLIWDDHEKWIDLETWQEIDGENPRTEIYIEPTTKKGG